MVGSVLAIDPGSLKCGVAVVSRTEGTLAKTVVGKEDLPTTVRLLVARYSPDALVIGCATGCDDVIRKISPTTLPVHRIDERLSTQLARLRFFKENPPRGWRRMIPRGLLVPNVPYDDYAAVLLAERFLALPQSDDPAASL